MDILKQWRYKLLMPAGVFEISDYHTSAKFKRSERLNGRQILPRGDGAAIILSVQIVAVGWLVGAAVVHMYLKVKVNLHKNVFHLVFAK